MPQNPCFRETFQPNTPFTSSFNYQPVANKVGGFIAADMGRPYVPYVGGIIDPTNLTTIIPDTVVNNKAHIAVFLDYFNQVRQASINYVQDVVGTCQIDPNSPFAGYLYKTTFSNNAAWTRYLQLAGLVVDFWNNANAAWTVEQYYAALDGLRQTIINIGSRDLYIPNALYNFDAANAFGVSWQAYKTAVPAVKGFLTVEFLQ